MLSTLAKLLPRYSRLSVLSLAALAAAWGCQPAAQVPANGGDEEVPANGADEETPPGAAALLDPQVIALDAAAPEYRFDGAGGSLLPGAGFSTAELTRMTEEREVPFVWVLGTRAELFFEAPSDGPLDFYASAHRFDFPEAPEQRLTLVLDGREVGSAPLTADWQEHRIPLPDPLGATADNTTTLHRLVLRFSYATRPSQVSENADERELSAAFAALAILPRGWSATRPMPRATLDAASRRLTLQPGSAVTIPFRGAGHFELRLGTVSTDKRSSGAGAVELAIELLSPGSDRRTLWHGPPAEAANRSWAGSVTSQALYRIRLSAGRQTGVSPGEAGGTVEIELPPAYLRLTAQSTQATRDTQTGSATAEPPHIFIYLIDTLRADALGVYGSRAAVSPRLDAFASEAVVYEKAWSPSSWTLPAVASLFTGTFPFEHGLMTGLHGYSGDPELTLASRLRSAGFHTIGLSHSPLVGPAHGLNAGFTRFHLNDQLTGTQLRSARLRRYLTSELATASGATSPLFVYLHGVAPHAPYSDSEELARLAREAPEVDGVTYSLSEFLFGSAAQNPAAVDHFRARYLGEVHYADREFGRFLDLLQHLGLYDNSVIAVLADHGEEFGEHGAFSHGRTLFEEVIHVPLMVKYPHSRWAATRLRQRVSTLDLTRTLLDLAGVETEPGELAGRSLLPPELVGRGERALFSEIAPLRGPRLEPVDLAALVLGSVKCIHSAGPVDQLGREIPPWRIFDLASDPAESQPLPGDSEADRRCRRELERWLAVARRRPSTSAPEGALEDERRRQLRALGYIE